MSKEEKKIKDNEMLEFVAGIILLAVGLFMFASRVRVNSGWYGFTLWGVNLSSGVVTIPLIIGLIWYFIKPKSIAPKILILLSVVIIIVSVIMSISIRLVSISLFEYILIFTLAAAGFGLILKTIFTDKK